MTPAARPSTQPGFQDRLRLGAVIYTLGMLLLASMDAGIKLVVDTVPIAQIWLCRTAFSLIPMAIYIFGIERRGVREALTTKQMPLQVLRGVFGAATFLAVVVALQNSELAAVAAFALTAPLVMLILGVWFLGETATPRLLTIAFVGCGAAFLMVPTSNDITVMGAIFAFLSAVFHAMAAATGRYLAQHDVASTTALYSNLVALACAVVFIIGVGWTPISAMDLAISAMIGILGGASYLALALAVKYIEVSRAAVLEYTVYVWAALLGIVLFWEFPSLAQGLAVIIIVYCGLQTARGTEPKT